MENRRSVRRSEEKQKMITLVNVRPLSGGKFLSNCNVTIGDDGKIVAVGNQTAGEVIRFDGEPVAAGYIDIHTHGGYGKDCMEPTYECIDTIARYHLDTGITSFCPTTMTASPEDINKAVDNIRKYDSRYARIAGVHLEGPYLSQKAAGAHPPHLLISPLDDDSFVRNNLDIVKRVTIAPNVRGSAEFTAEYSKKGVQISLGHDNSIDDEIYPCIEAGATSVTHMYNCTSRPSRRDNPKKHLGLTEVGLIDNRITTEIIADDRHVANTLFKMIYKLKGYRRICLVSDSLSVAGMPAGDYYIGAGDSKQSIRVEDGVAVLPSENTYAGSVTPVSKMVCNLIGCGIAPAHAIYMATKVPARLICRKDIGDIKVGCLADINVLDTEDYSVKATFLGGQVRYRR